MARYVLTAIDTTQIQGYVFGSNRLKENIGGSELVELATHRWVYDALPPDHNVTNLDTGELDVSKTIDNLEAEVVYAGGGNTVILFMTIELARAFAGRLTLRVLRDAPGLEIVVAHREFDWETEPLAEVVQRTLGVDLARKKQTRVRSTPLLGLGVTVPCSSTGLVASGVEDDKPVSREIKAKVAADIQTSARRRLQGLLPRISEGGWNIALDFDKLGRIKGEEGYIAVVHADGNGMGKRVEAVAQRYATAEQNREYINAMRALSDAINAAAVRALQRVVDLMANAIVNDAELAEIHRDAFPLRPLVFGGDDVTFVCNGRYGLPLAICYLQAFKEETAKEEAFDRKPAFACAGVAVVKVHYPFARAYSLSDQLCKSAKKRARDEEQDCAALDWHFAMSGLTGSLDAIREREYTVKLDSDVVGDLTMRPVFLDASPHTWQTWPVFKSLLDEFMTEHGEWYDRRNKIKALRDALRAGPHFVKEFLRTYRLNELPEARSINVTGYRETGWDGQRCIYFDPIEATDFYTDLEETAGMAGKEAAHAHI